MDATLIEVTKVNTNKNSYELVGAHTNKHAINNPYVARYQCNTMMCVGSVNRGVVIRMTLT